jgi:hypothetical protein
MCECNEINFFTLGIYAYNIFTRSLIRERKKSLELYISFSTWAGKSRSRIGTEKPDHEASRLLDQRSNLKGKCHHYHSFNKKLLLFNDESVYLYYPEFSGLKTQTIHLLSFRTCTLLFHHASSGYASCFHCFQQ